MTAATLAPPMETPKAFAVWFKDLERWSVDHFRRVEWKWPTEVIRPIGEALVYKRVEVAGDIERVELPIIEKISFGGVVSVTQPERRKGYKGRLFWAEPGELVYSKIRVKQGSLAVVPESVGRLAVSAEYPVYAIDRDRADGRYLELVVRSSAFLRMLDGIAHGGGTKTRIAPDEFEQQGIPLPPLSVQRAIVSAWEQAQAEVADTRRRIAELEDKIEADLLADLGLTKPQRAKLPKVFAVWWKDVERWGVQPNQLAATAIDVHGGKYPVATGQDFLQDITHGCSASPSPKPTPLEVLKISAVTRGALDLSERKFMHDRAEYRRQFDMRAGDVLLCRTNGTLGLVGMSALVENDIDDIIFPDKVIRLRPKGNVLPAYLWKALHMPFARSQIEAAARTAVGNFAIGTDDLWNMELPLPPLPVQRQLVAKVAAQRKKIAAMKANAQQKTEQAKAEVEAMILGERKVSP